MTFNYDQFGNMGCAASLVTGCPYLTYSSNNINNQVVGYTYDAAGNVLWDGYFYYLWDPEGHLLSVTGWSLFATYGYDGKGQPVTATVTSSAIGIGGAVARSPLPHHRTDGARIRRFRDLSP